MTSVKDTKTQTTVPPPVFEMTVSCHSHSYSHTSFCCNVYSVKWLVFSIYKTVYRIRTPIIIMSTMHEQHHFVNVVYFGVFYTVCALQANNNRLSCVSFRFHIMQNVFLFNLITCSAIKASKINVLNRKCFFTLSTPHEWRIHLI